MHNSMYSTHTHTHSLHILLYDRLFQPKHSWSRVNHLHKINIQKIKRKKKLGLWRNGIKQSLAYNYHLFINRQLFMDLWTGFADIKSCSNYSTLLQYLLLVCIQFKCRVRVNRSIDLHWPCMLFRCINKTKLHKHFQNKLKASHVRPILIRI